jgi:tRNA pseudouridine55 synthase
VDGVLIVDKPSGPTSHDIVGRARRALGLRRVCHTGTLDPFATGVLPLCLGRVTRLARFLAAGDKVYRATVRLGFATSTDDLTGEALSAPRDVRLDEAEVRRALRGLVGVHDQLPPAYSARRVKGRRLYDMARRGEAVPRTARPVTIYAVDLLGMDRDALDLEVRCSPGTYIRAMARDLGEALGVGGHLSALRRTRSGDFTLDRAVPGDALEEGRDRLVPMGELLPRLPAVRVGPAGRDLVRHGRDVESAAISGDLPASAVERVRILDEAGDLLALAVPRAPSPPGAPLVPAVLHPDVVLIG